MNACPSDGLDAAGSALLLAARRWLDAGEPIGALLPGIPEPAHVGEVRAILLESIE